MRKERCGVRVRDDGKEVRDEGGKYKRLGRRDEL